MPSKWLWTMEFPLKIIKKEIRLGNDWAEPNGPPHYCDALVSQFL
jgi:hypothetical protein